MTTTFIDSSTCAKVDLPDGQGTLDEILNRELCGAENGVGMLRWLASGDQFDSDAKSDKHQLIYLMDGDGVIVLEGKDYEVKKGAGIYLGPGESASVRPAENGEVKLFHLVVRDFGDD